MTELDQMWSQMLQTAEARAEPAGRRDIVEYLRLKAANDAIRGEGIRWLFDAAVELASEVNRKGAIIQIERVEPYNFKRGTSNMSGSQIQLTHGVRCLSLDAGWTRTPSDGIMRRGALAAARLRHFGLKRSNAELSLAYAGELPIWHVEDETGRRPFRLVDLSDHIRVFLDI